MALGKKTGGRKKGTKNKATAEVKELALVYVPEAVEVLAKQMRSAKHPAAKISAANSILDRACGRPPQAIQHSGDDERPALRVEIHRVGA